MHAYWLRWRNDPLYKLKKRLESSILYYREFAKDEHADTIVWLDRRLKKVRQAWKQRRSP